MDDCQAKRVTNMCSDLLSGSNGGLGYIDRIMSVSELDFSNSEKVNKAVVNTFKDLRSFMENTTPIEIISKEIMNCGKFDVLKNRMFAETVFEKLMCHFIVNKDIAIKCGYKSLLPSLFAKRLIDNLFNCEN